MEFTNRLSKECIVWVWSTTFNLSLTNLSFSSINHTIKVYVLIVSIFLQWRKLSQSSTSIQVNNLNTLRKMGNHDVWNFFKLFHQFNILLQFFIGILSL